MCMYLVLKRRDSEGKLMFHIALMNGDFEIVKYLIDQWPSSLDNVEITLDSMSVFHLALTSAACVPSNLIP